MIRRRTNNVRRRTMKKTSLKELNLYFNIMNVKLFLLNQEIHLLV